MHCPPGALCLCSSQTHDAFWSHSKESANCRLELNYGVQNEDVDLIPLMMEANYRPRGWLGLICLA